MPEYDCSANWVLYLPLAYNHPAVDALLVHLDQKTMQAHLYPIQVTVAGRHKDSETVFFSNWDKWCSDLHGAEYTVSATFLWIDATDQFTTEEIEARTRSSRSGQHPLNPSYEVKHIPLSVIANNAWGRYQESKRKLIQSRN